MSVGGSARMGEVAEGWKPPPSSSSVGGLLQPSRKASRGEEVYWINWWAAAVQQYINNSGWKTWHTVISLWSEKCLKERSQALVVGVRTHCDAS